MDSGVFAKCIRSLPPKVVLMSGCTGTGLFELVAKELFAQLSELTGKKFEARWQFLEELKPMATCMKHFGEVEWQWKCQVKIKTLSLKLTLFLSLKP